jgi:hypothetical protein
MPVAIALKNAVRLVGKTRPRHASPSTGRDVVHHPRGGHDDLINAAALACLDQGLCLTEDTSARTKF